MARLEPYWDVLRRMTAAPDICVEFSVAAYVDSQAPALSLDQATVERLAYIGATIDIDIILLEPSGDKNLRGGP